MLWEGRDLFCKHFCSDKLCNPTCSEKTDWPIVSITQILHKEQRHTVTRGLFAVTLVLPTLNKFVFKHRFNVFIVVLYNDPDFRFLKTTVSHQNVFNNTTT